MSENYNDKDKMYDIMNTTQCNYSNMLKRLQYRKKYSNFIITYYSIILIIYSLTSGIFPDCFNGKLSNYFNIILSMVVLVYSLIISNANYSERIHSAEKIMNKVKSLKRELKDKTVSTKREEYDKIMADAEYRSEIDFFRTLKQKCKENNIRWYRYKIDILKSDMSKKKQVEKLNNYLSENFPMTQQTKIILLYLWDLVIMVVPVMLFILCFLIKE